MQQEFINIAAHELRTPTQSILGYTELAKEAVLCMDVETWMESKRGMSDEEFHKMMKQNMMK